MPLFNIRNDFWFNTKTTTTPQINKRKKSTEQKTSRFDRTNSPILKEKRSGTMYFGRQHISVLVPDKYRDSRLIAKFHFFFLSYILFSLWWSIVMLQDIPFVTVILVKTVPGVKIWRIILSVTVPLVTPVQSVKMVSKIVSIILLYNSEPNVPEHK
jgi:hypothetical protein